MVTSETGDRPTNPNNKDNVDKKYQKEQDHNRTREESE